MEVDLVLNKICLSLLGTKHNYVELTLRTDAQPGSSRPDAEQSQLHWYLNGVVSHVCRE